MEESVDFNNLGPQNTNKDKVSDEYLNLDQKDVSTEKHEDECPITMVKKTTTKAFSDSESDSDKPSSVSKITDGEDSEINDDTFAKKLKKNRTRKNYISSDEDGELSSTNNKINLLNNGDNSDSDVSNAETEIVQRQAKKSRIRRVSSSDEDYADNGPGVIDQDPESATINTVQPTRIKYKEDKMRNKFRNLLSSRRSSKATTDIEISAEEAPVRNSQDNSSKDSSEGSDDEELKTIKQKIQDRNESLKSAAYTPCVSDEATNEENKTKSIKKRRKNNFKVSNSSGTDESGDEDIRKIKKKIKERNETLKATIYDPDTSDDEEPRRPSTPKAKSIRKSTKMISPQPVRMSAKQAMENMQKIKSESNRMLREKEISLPYHRPKALSLKDIMSRRKPALSSNGKALPIKMNDEQLRQYAKQLEQRQKEMMELCKSDTDDDDAIEDASKPCQAKNHDSNFVEDNNTEHVNKSNAEDNDKSFDELNLNFLNSCQEKESKDEHDSSKIPNVDMDICAEEQINGKSKDDSPSKSTPAVNEDAVIKTITDSFNTDNRDKSNELDNSKEEKTSKEEAPNPNSDMSTKIANNTEEDSQLIHLHYNNSENVENNNEIAEKSPKNVKDSDNKEREQNINLETADKNTDIEETSTNVDKKVQNAEIEAGISTQDENVNTAEQNKVSFEDEDDLFDHDDINMDDIDRLIENAEILNVTNSDSINSPMLVREPPNLNAKPKLTGAPGMVIDLDGTDPVRKKLSGVELLKERFIYFADLKTPEELERSKEKKIKPGTQHSKLKHDLEEQMADQRSLEWAKRLDEDKKQQEELKALRGDESGEEEDIDKFEAKLAETEADVDGDESSSESEEEPEENDVEIKDKPKKNNPLISDEAEESDCDGVNDNDVTANETNDKDIESNDDSNEESSDESSDDDENYDSRPKKGRILKAFEDSDEEDADAANEENGNQEIYENGNDMANMNIGQTTTQITQDDELQSAQLEKSISENLFASQDPAMIVANSIEESDGNVKNLEHSNKITDEDKDSDGNNSKCVNNLTVITETQPYDDAKFDDIAGMCSGSFSQNIATTQIEATQPMQTQDLGDDVLALCTGQFYDNQFITQGTDAENTESQTVSNQDNNIVDNIQEKSIEDTSENVAKIVTKSDDKNLQSILDELDDPEFNEPRSKIFFPGNAEHNTGNQQKKRLVIDSDDEEGTELTEVKSKKKIKKKKLQDRALQISDDEEDDFEEQNEYEDIMSDLDEQPDRIVEYDSEENEVEVHQPLQTKKTKRKMAEFFENEAELTSEDEYMGSGDEDERGLDRMEREAGDDDTFHQGRLQAELGQIHMREVLDQDKREVRLIQELLFEDGDLGDGHRQRKFRWRNDDGVEETGTGLDEFGDTQEEEFESEEQWRKQRHEREKTDNDESIGTRNVSITRTSIIKANLVSKTMSSLLMDVTSTDVDNSLADRSVTKCDSPLVLDKKSTKDIPSPVKKPFFMMQQNYRGSILSRGSGALARLAALATPLAGDCGDNVPSRSTLAPGKRSFVFATVSPKTEDKPKVVKRKGEENAGTPQLMKKMKTEDKKGLVRTSLLDHFKV